jgi:choline dehydrogenase-like flavoprotein
MSDANTYDYIIVGAGSAGCLLANRLSADRGTRVLLLEAGGQDDWVWYHIPIGYLFSIGNPRSDWCYGTEPEPALGGRAIPYPRGKVVGGSSAINGMIYMRGHAADFDQWRQLGLSGWSWDDVLPCFKAHEDFCGGADEAHGAGGELRVDPPRVSWPVLDVVKRAAIEAGIKAVEDFNRGDNEGVGPLHVNQRRGLRFQAAKAFLRPALIRAQPDAGNRRPGGAHPPRRRPCRRGGLSRQGYALHGQRAARGDPGGRGGRLAAAPHAVGNRTRRTSRRARHRG